MVLSRKSKGKLSNNHKILLRELDELTVETPVSQLKETKIIVPTPSSLGSQTKKKPGRPKGPSLINTSKLLTG